MSENNNEIIIYTDGGSQGNPGPAAIGALIKMNSEEKEEYNKRIGEATNNIAEYKAAIFGLEKLKQKIGKEKASEKSIKLKSDSELLVNQVQGKYKVKSDNLKELFIDLWNIMQDFKSVEFELIPREDNQAADRLVNKSLFS
ncbi:MAG: ribonuclease HI family protein [Candidatus Magasanikbacteria bacterium]